jgi:methyltransferase-like protein
MSVFGMVKTVDLPLRVHEDLVKVSEELSLMAKKSISTSMAIDLLMEIYRAHLNNPCALDAFSQQLRSLNIMSPQEFDKYWDEPTKTHQTKYKAKSNK